MRAITLVLIAASISGAGALAAAQPATDAIASVRAFAEQYHRDTPALVAYEEYVQNATYSIRTAEHQVTTAELVMVKLQDGAGSVWFRDVLTVNKRQVRDREERLLKLLQSPEPSAPASVPIKMTERYSMTGETIDAVARYSDFRSFTVSTTEKLTKPPIR